ncbi:MAG: response regulator [Legionellales bacterium]|nr:response regulator [Legionellales bacterium]
MRLLIVDDDLNFQYICQRLLQSNPALEEIGFACHGEEALNKINQYDLVLLDINMPVMDGFELLNALQHSSFAPPPILMMLTSSEETRDIKKALGYQFVKKFLIKEVDNTLMANTLNEAINEYL